MYELIERLPISYLHVFPFSRRKGTPAFHFDHQVDPVIIKNRCARMRELGKKKQRAFVKANLNKKLEGLVQYNVDKKTGVYKAVTSNYLTVFLNQAQDYRGKILDLILEQCDKDMNLIGKIISPV
jgi:threonylcarbamoyladenosine tRNA methylthiotransferase MtaB